MEEKFGKLEQSQGDDQGRTIFCHSFLWSPKLYATPEREEASAADPQARELWNRAIEWVMPPATAWQQERWDIREVPRFYPPEPEFDPEELAYDQEQQSLTEEHLRFHNFEVGEGSQ